MQEFKGQLKAPYQTVGANRMIYNDEHQCGGILADEMGLGKTIQTIYMLLSRPISTTLLVVPKLLLKQWQSEINKFAPSIKVIVFYGKCIHNISSLTKFRGSRTVILTTYHTILSSRNISLFRDEFDRIIIDEGHEIRNNKSMTYKAMMSFKQEYGSRWVLTGTPIVNRKQDFRSLVSFVMKVDKVTEMMENYAKEKMFIRRTKKEVAAEKLPPLEMTNVELDPYPEELDHYEDVFQTKNKNYLEAYLRLRQVQADPSTFPANKYKKRCKKIEYLVEEVQKHTEEKTLIFCTFQKEIDNLARNIRSSTDYQVYKIDGRLENGAREQVLEYFKMSTKPSILILQINVGGVGLNLQHASRIYLMSPAWNPSVELQAIGRCHRMGQEKTVRVQKLYYVNDRSVEHAIVLLQQKKTKISKDELNIDNDITFSDTPSPLELKEIFEV